MKSNSFPIFLYMKVEVCLETLDREFRNLARKYGDDVIGAYKRILEEIYKNEVRMALIESIFAMIFAIVWTFLFAWLQTFIHDIRLAIIYTIGAILAIVTIYASRKRVETIEKYIKGQPM